MTLIEHNIKTEPNYTCPKCNEKYWFLISDICRKCFWLNDRTMHVNDIEVKQLGDKWFVRISIGDYMYFDSPPTTEKNATLTYYNLIGRVYG